MLMSWVKPLIWPGIVAGCLALLLYLVIDTKAENALLKKDMADIKTQISTAKDADVKNADIAGKVKAQDQQLTKDAGRKELVMKKPGLVELKINKSFNEYMENFEK